MLDEDIDPYDLDPAKLSLCSRCAKHDVLKRFVCAHAVEGIRCGICLSLDGPLCDLRRRQDLIYLIRSLMRFEYDESDFNTHFGAIDGPEALL